jgi:hypothetical protein
MFRCIVIKRSDVLYRTYKKREGKYTIMFENPEVNLPYNFEYLIINDFIVWKLTADEKLSSLFMLLRRMTSDGIP